MDIPPSVTTQEQEGIIYMMHINSNPFVGKHKNIHCLYVTPTNVKGRRRRWWKGQRWEAKRKGQNYVTKPWRMRLHHSIFQLQHHEEMTTKLGSIPRNVDELHSNVVYYLISVWHFHAVKHLTSNRLNSTTVLSSTTALLSNAKIVHWHYQHNHSILDTNLFFWLLFLNWIRMYVRKPKKKILIFATIRPTIEMNYWS